MTLKSHIEIYSDEVVKPRDKKKTTVDREADLAYSQNTRIIGIIFYGSWVVCFFIG